MTRWYRAYEGTVTDEKLAEVSIIAGCSRSVVIASWHAILENATSVNDNGNIETGPRRVAAALCEPVAIMEKVFSGLEEVGMLLNGGVTAWKRRQFESDSSTGRSRKHRQQQCNGDETLQTVSGTPSERPPMYMSSSSDSEVEERGSEEETRQETSKKTFAAWYAAFPRHQGRGAAEKAYKTALKKAKPEDLLAAAQRFSTLRRGEDPQFTPLPATWLNAERWLDEPLRLNVQAFSTAFVETDEVGWKGRAKAWRTEKWSPNWGPKPDEPGCRCPPEILKADIAA